MWSSLHQVSAILVNYYWRYEHFLSAISIFSVESKNILEPSKGHNKFSVKKNFKSEKKIWSKKFCGKQNLAQKDWVLKNLLLRNPIQRNCQAQPKPASQSPAWGGDSFIVKLILAPPLLVDWKAAVHATVKKSEALATSAAKLKLANN